MAAFWAKTQREQSSTVSKASQFYLSDVKAHLAGPSDQACRRRDQAAQTVRSDEKTLVNVKLCVFF